MCSTAITHEHNYSFLMTEIESIAYELLINVLDMSQRLLTKEE
jgi:hypothetical protein